MYISLAGVLRLFTKCLYLTWSAGGGRRSACCGTCGAAASRSGTSSGRPPPYALQQIFLVLDKDIFYLNVLLFYFGNNYRNPCFVLEELKY